MVWVWCLYASSYLIFNAEIFLFKYVVNHSEGLFSLDDYILQAHGELDADGNWPVFSLCAGCNQDCFCDIEETEDDFSNIFPNIVDIQDCVTSTVSQLELWPPLLPPPFFPILLSFFLILPALLLPWLSALLPLHLPCHWLQWLLASHSRSQRKESPENETEKNKLSYLEHSFKNKIRDHNMSPGKLFFFFFLEDSLWLFIKKMQWHQSFPILLTRLILHRFLQRTRINWPKGIEMLRRRHWICMKA